jgi:phosphatidylglycerol---prolipoprotein diacylglyceryl transferase
MRPILVNIPAKPLFALLLVAALVIFGRESFLRRTNRALPLSSTPLYLLGGALAVCWKFGDWSFGHAWKPLPIYAYGVMLGTSLVLGWFLAMKFAGEDNIDQQEAGTIYMWSAVWSIIGSRVLWWFTTPTATIWDLPLINQGGLVAYGGMIGGFLASVYGCRKRKIPLLKWADVSAPSVVLGTGITRIGCFLFGCDYGKPADLPWAVRFPGPNPLAPNGSPAWFHHVHDLGLAQTATRSLPVHPTQLYESLAGLALFGLLLLLRRIRRFSGEVFLGWVLGYGILRPIIEHFRDDDDRGIYTLPLTQLQFSTSQYIGGISVILGLGLLVYLLRRYRQDPEASRLWLTPAVATASAAPVTGGAVGRERAANKRRKRR